MIPSETFIKNLYGSHMPLEVQNTTSNLFIQLAIDTFYFRVLKVITSREILELQNYFNCSENS